MDAKRAFRHGRGRGKDELCAGGLHLGDQDPLKSGVSMTEVVEDLNKMLRGWFNYFRHCFWNYLDRNKIPPETEATKVIDRLYNAADMDTDLRLSLGTRSINRFCGSTPALSGFSATVNSTSCVPAVNCTRCLWSNLP